MSVCEIAEDTLVEPDHVYIEPRGHDVAIREGTLRREPAARGVPHLPIDLFFRALALDQGSHAAGIVLSGTGTDGTLGLAAIRAASGLALVQDPATAEFDGMPVSAIEAGAADFVLPPGEMPARLLVDRKALVSPPRADGGPELSPNDIQSILAVIRKRRGLDFSEYKHGTLGRRIARRMQLHGIDDPQEYARHLDQSDAEIDILWHDWLIGVSSFFRDPKAFRALESELAELIAGRQDGSPLRMWVPACATGEEAYSLVMLLVETLRRMNKALEVQVFATDLNPAAIQVARAGRYPEGIAADVGDSRLARFFVREDGCYRVKREVRDLVVFAVQNALQRPALHPRGPRVLPEPPDLPGAEGAASAAPLLPLQPESSRTPPARFIRERNRFRGPLRATREQLQDLPEKRLDSAAAGDPLAVPVRCEPERPGRRPSRREKDRSGESAEQGAGGILRPARRARRRDGSGPADPWRHRRLSRTPGGACQHEHRGDGAGRPAWAACLGPPRSDRGRRSGRRTKRPPPPRRRPPNGPPQGVAAPRTAARCAAVPRLLRVGRAPCAQAQAQERAHRSGRRGPPRGEAGTGAPERAPRPAGHHRRAPDRQRGARLGERGAPEYERGAPEHERRAPDHQGGDTIAQRGAAYRECGAHPEAPGLGRGEQRPDQPHEQHRGRHHLPGRAAQGEAFYAAGAPRRAPARRRHRTSSSRPGHPARLPGSPGGCSKRHRDPSRVGEAGSRSGRQLVPGAHPAVSYSAKRRRGRGRHVHRHHRYEAPRTARGGAAAGGEHRGRGARALPGPGRRAPRRAGQPCLLPVRSR